MKIKVTFSVPLIPPSVNHYKKPSRNGGYYVTKEAQAFIDAVAILSDRQLVSGRYYHIAVVFFIEEKRFLRCDADNLEKVAFDALKAAGIITDDRYITRHFNQKIPIPLSEQKTVYTVLGSETP